MSDIPHHPFPRFTRDGSVLLERVYDRFPYVPADPTVAIAGAIGHAIFDSGAFVKRLKSSRIPNVVLGISHEPFHSVTQLVSSLRIWMC